MEKDKYGLSLQPDDTTEEKANDKFFSFLHPEFKLDLSSVLKPKRPRFCSSKKGILATHPKRNPLLAVLTLIL